MANMKSDIRLSVLVLVCINVMDSIMGAVVGPTLIFYVIDIGGNKAQYGMMKSIVSLASMIAIPIFGNWVDTNGNKYIVPYLTSFGLGIMSYTIYFLVILLPKGPIAIYSLMFSRFLDGMAMASRTLSYSWVASTIPADETRIIFTLLASSRTFGMVVGPLTNYLVSEVNTEFEIFGVTIPVDSNNSIGLLMVGGMLILSIMTLVFLEEPPTKEEELEKKHEAEHPNIQQEQKGVWYALTHFNIFFPVFTMFTLMANYCLVGTALPPAARNMGWDPVEISEVSAYGSGVLALGMVISTIVSTRNVSDFVMMSFGFGTMMLSGGLMYAWLAEGVGYWQFTGPIYLIFFSYPFIGPANRSIFTKAIYTNKELEGSYGIMMSLLNQSAAFAGFIAPTVVAMFILRKPEDIVASTDKHELTKGALYVPILSALIIAGLIYQHIVDLRDNEASADDTGAVSESTMLVSSAQNKISRVSVLQINQTLSRSSEIYRRTSVECEGIPNPFETKYEMEMGEKILTDKEFWEEFEYENEIDT